MIDAHWLNPPPTRDYGIFISPPEALSPSAPLGLSEEACRRSSKMLMWFPPSRPAPTLLLFSALETFPLINLINGQETDGAGVRTSIMAHHKCCSYTLFYRERGQEYKEGKETL